MKEMWSSTLGRGRTRLDHGSRDSQQASREPSKVPIRRDSVNSPIPLRRAVVEEGAVVLGTLGDNEWSRGVCGVGPDRS